MRTRVGYAGGRHPDPTYYNLGDHTESFQVDFDPQRVTYAQLLDVFWQSHNHCARPGSRQYMSAVFWHDEQQYALAVRTREHEATRRGAPITTQLLPVGTFYLAEDYHQKYLLRRRGELFREFDALYPDWRELTASTAAAKVNGYLGGNGDAVQLEEEIGGFGLSERGQQTLRGHVRRGR
ncbi:MAG: peptide-methionine (S)-S-oxide reductase [Planctomycetia bacterium]|nr:peptide-methionine (S)-S-oxide reductase [Planctomycetia bacterium]